MNDVTMLVLMSLADGPKHGHAIQQDILDTTGTRLGPGSLYDAISRLEREDLIVQLEPAGRRKPYELTVSGRTELRERTEQLRTLVRNAEARLATS